MRPKTFAQQTQAARTAIIKSALAAHDGNRTAAAKTLKIERTYLQRLIRQFGLGTNGKRG